MSTAAEWSLLGLAVLQLMIVYLLTKAISAIARLEKRLAMFDTALAIILDTIGRIKSPDRYAPPTEAEKEALRSARSILNSAIFAARSGSQRRSD